MEITVKKESHPWLNTRVMDLVAKKHAGHGSTIYAEAVEECRKGIVEEFSNYANESRKKLCEVKCSSKCWWTISRGLSMQRVKTQSMPALKSDEVTWAHEPKIKADLLAKTLCGKNVLPDPYVKAYSTIHTHTCRQQVKHMRSLHDACKTLEAVDVNSGTGGDLLPALIL